VSPLAPAASRNRVREDRRCWTLGHLQVGPGEGSTIRALAEEFDPLYRAQIGFKAVFVLGDEVSGEYGPSACGSRRTTRRRGTP
jgi:hypothetical protein